MIKKINIRNTLIIVLSVSLVALALGFIIISGRLESLKNKGQSFDVKFTNIKQINSIKGGSKNPVGKIDVLNDGKVLDMNFELYKERDEIDYEVTIKNEGTIDAEIDGLLMSPDYEGSYKESIKPISVVMTNIDGKILEPEEEITIKISVLYNVGSTGKTSKIKAKVGLLSSSK